MLSVRGISLSMSVSHSTTLGDIPPHLATLLWCPCCRCNNEHQRCRSEREGDISNISVVLFRPGGGGGGGEEEAAGERHKDDKNVAGCVAIQYTQHKTRLVDHIVST